MSWYVRSGHSLSRDGFLAWAAAEAGKRRQQQQKQEGDTNTQDQPQNEWLPIFRSLSTRQVCAVKTVPVWRGGEKIFFVKDLMTRLTQSLNTVFWGCSYQKCTTGIPPLDQCHCTHTCSPRRCWDTGLFLNTEPLLSYIHQGLKKTRNTKSKYKE